MDAMTTLEAVSQRVSAGDTVTRADARLLLATHDLIAVGTMADDVRRRLRGGATTFVRVFEVHVDAVPASLPPGLTAGEVRLVGDPQSLDRARGAVAAARRLAGEIPLTGFSLADLPAWGGALHDICAALRDAGLDAVAEVPIDRVTNAPRTVEAARSAGLRVLRMTVEGRDEGDPVDLLERALELQHTAGGFQAFAPLPRDVSATAPTTGYDDVKLVAVARLMVAGVPSIQVDWPLYGPKLAQVALTVGADDVDGVAADAGTLGPRRSPIEEITNNIRAAGLEPAERDGLFDRRG
jgi:2-iminoacetate synthase ThiH